MSTNDMAGKQILALMSGTSVDTIDAAICRVWQCEGGRLGCEVLAFHEHEIDGGLRSRIFKAFGDGAHSLSLCCSLNFEIGRAFAEAARAAMDAWGEDRAAIAAIASHGQTLYHIAPHMVAGGGMDDAVASTLQVGDMSVIAEGTGLPVIGNFRVADMAVGGNGAPLVPFADYHLFSEPGRGVVVHNLGGIGNCTWLPPDGDAGGVIAFDTGPANMMIDAFVAHFYPGEQFDRDGQHAADGMVMTGLLNEWMNDPYISAPPPKSTGRERYGVDFVKKVIARNPGAAQDNLIATATEFTAMSLADNLRRHVMPRGRIDRVLLAGGGTRNRFLVERIRDLLAAEISAVDDLDSLGHSVTSKSRECAGFAIMGFAHLEGLTANLPSVTGARRAVVLGQMAPVP